MEIPKNLFKQALRGSHPQIGCWLGLADGYAAELLATCGFDWLLVDAEHAPNDLRTVLHQLQAIAPYPTHPVVRPVNDDVALIKQYLDIGAQTLLIPMIETAEQAARAVAATRYPPAGIRGVGSSLARASRWNQVDGYLQRASTEMCVLVQVESATAIRNLEAIAKVDGVDGVFFGPSDLAASLGFLGRPAEGAVQEAIVAGISTVRRAGKAAGILSADRALAWRYLELGAQFVAVAVDTTLLANAAKDVLSTFKKSAPTPAGDSQPSVY